MLPSISKFFVKSSKIYLSVFTKMWPYFIILAVFSFVILLKDISNVVLVDLIKNVYLRTSLIGLAAFIFSLLSFSLSISIVRFFSAFVTNSILPKFFSNLKESFFIAWKHVGLVLIFMIPTILIYSIFIASLAGVLSFGQMIISNFVLLFLLLLVVLWFVVLGQAVALENAGSFASIKNSIFLVKGRVFESFLLTALPLLLVSIVFNLIFDSILTIFLSTDSWFYSLLLLFAVICIFSFSLLLTTLLYFELKNNKNIENV
ncbi:MAG: hypothetical protein WC070_03005 [Candidatus Magasanikbacteria bacterium]